MRPSLDCRMGTVYPIWVRSLVEQLRDAYLKAKWTMDELVEKSGLDIDRSALRRKILDVKDPIPMKTEEAEALANALGVTLVVIPDEAKAS